MACRRMLKAFRRNTTKTYAFSASRLDDTRKFDGADGMAAAGMLTGRGGGVRGILSCLSCFVNGGGSSGGD